ncbi:TonB-dependent siderophore receptor [Vibrio fluminensis]|uniref:TonB-dependent siderophore receptor n=1 Tax=Vibrio fluminensis TaxID=2783614 RepID=UPI001886CBFC|nr:TonB-dependent siderophore receptor [Vibrio fluminensis]
MESPMRYIFTPSNIALAVCVALSHTAIAQEDVPKVEEVVVWGTKVSSNTESIFAEDMSVKQADHISDLLREVPGVDVGGTHSVNQRISIRGLGETDLDIRLDGASQHANMFHHIGNLTLNPDILKSADIQVGNNSVTQNGLGGSVYFETKDARDLLRYDESFGARIYGGYASNDSQQGSLTLYGLLSENIDAMLYGHYVTRDDFEDGNGNKAFGTKGDVYNILSKIGYELGEIHRFEFSYDLYRDSGDYNPRPDMSGTANNGLSQDRLIPTDYSRDTVTLSYQLRADNHKGDVTLYNTETEIVRDETVMAGAWPGNRVSENSAKNQNVGLNIKFESAMSLFGIANQIVYGADYMDKTSSSYYGATQFMEESAISTALFAENKFIVSDLFNLSAGLRFEDYKRKAEVGTNKYDDVTWSLAAELNPVDGLVFFASTRTLFKGPELLETFIAYQDVAMLQDGLKAETGRNTQGGVRYEQRFDRHTFGMNFTLFQTDIDNYIAEAYNRTTGRYDIYNLADVEIEGFETSISYGFDAFASKISYSKSDTTNKETGGPVVGGNGRSIDMGDNIALTLNYQSDALDSIFGWNSIWVKEEDNVLDGQPAKQSYNVHNVYAQWVPQSIDGLSITIGIDNIFDEYYASHASRSGIAPRGGIVMDDYEPGRNYKISAAYQF